MKIDSGYEGVASQRGAMPGMVGCPREMRCDGCSHWLGRERQALEMLGDEALYFWAIEHQVTWSVGTLEAAELRKQAVVLY